MIGGVFTEPLLRVLGTPPDVLADAIGYARVMMLAMPGLLVFILSTQLLRGVGDTMTPLFALLLSTAVVVRADAGVHPRLGRPAAARRDAAPRRRRSRRSSPRSAFSACTCVASPIRWRPIASSGGRCASIPSCFGWWCASGCRPACR